MILLLFLLFEWVFGMWFLRNTFSFLFYCNIGDSKPLYLNIDVTYFGDKNEASFKYQ